MQIITARNNDGFKLILYGTPGVGKSTLAAEAPAPVFFDLESGLGRIDCARTPRLDTWWAVNQAAGWFVQQRDYQTAVIDTLDVLEQLIHDEVCRAGGKPSIEKFGFGSGYKAATQYWMQLCLWADQVAAQGRNVILVGHDNVKTYNNPMTDAYDRINIRVHRESAALLVGRFDACMFAHWETVIRSDAKNDERKYAMGTGQRMLQCVESPAVVAKNRFGLPQVVAMDRNIYAAMVPQQTQKESRK